LLGPIRAGQAELVLGRRRPAPGSMTPPQRFGTWLAITLIHLRWRVRYADLGPFRAIQRTAFEPLGMMDATWGWTVEMQILAIRRGLRHQEVSVSWESRQAGHSKISGTINGVARAGAKILWTVVRQAIR
jgi:hypothetical protein